MNTAGYAQAKTAVHSLNRFVNHHVRARKGETQSDFLTDRQTARSLLICPNILGFGVGPKVISGKRDHSAYCVVMFVRKKLPKSRLRDLMAVPTYISMNTSGLQIQTDVQEWGGPPVAHGALFAGASIGDVAGHSGTMTLAVQDNSDNTSLILSCSHVLARCGMGNVGDEIESPSNPALDPGPNVVASLLRFTRIDSGSLTNAVDAAVAIPGNGIDLSNMIAGIGTPCGIRDLTLEGEAAINNVNVQRVGIITGLQIGTIRNIHVSTRITYPQLPADPSIQFVDLVQYEASSQAGDSGAAVLDTTADNNVVGMHIAGTQDGSASFFTHIRYVFERMQVSFNSSSP
jgi:hypothetical protein